MLLSKITSRLGRPLSADARSYFHCAADFYFVGLGPSHGQDPPASNSAPAPIATDRPAATNSSIVVPVGSLQAENGFLVTNLRGQNTADGSETLVRDRKSVV